MADNITLNAGSGGSVVATDDDGTAHHQYVKVEFGAVGRTTSSTISIEPGAGDDTELLMALGAPLRVEPWLTAKAAGNERRLRSHSAQPDVGSQLVDLPDQANWQSGVHAGT